MHDGPESFGERLARLRDRKGLTQAQLAARVDVKPQYVSKLERDAIGDPGLDLVTKLASVVGWDLFGFPSAATRTAPQPLRDGPTVIATDPDLSAPDIPREEFIERDYDYPRPYHVGDVPVNHQLTAGSPMEDTSNHEDDASVLRTSYRDVQSGRYIVVRVRGDSMEGRLHDGDLVLIDTFDKAIKPEGIFAVYIRGEGSTLAYVHISAGVVVVTKQNPRHPPRVYHDTERVLIQGRVKKRLEENLD